MHRRTFSQLGLGAATCALLHAAPARAADKPLTKVRIALSSTVLNVTYPMLSLPVTLGYWKQEGYDVDVMPVGASLQSIQQLVAGNVEFGEVNASVVVQANAKNNLPVRIAMGNGVLDWSIAVDADGPIRSAKDLKGKTIGVFSLATGGIAYFDSYLRANGLRPDDVDLLPLGLGVAPVQAMRTGKVQGLLYWASAVAGFQNAGLKLRKMIGSDWRHYPDYSLAVMQQTIDKDPGMVLGIVRGMAKATVYALTSPDCARRLHWEHYPASKPSGADEATLIHWDLNTLQGQLDSMQDAYKLNGGKLWGNADPAVYQRLVEFMLQAKQIDKPLDARTMIVNIPDFFQKANQFDAKTVRAAAMACKA
jgi:NitT/TauT family transport system substrate-binding protein